MTDIRAKSFWIATFIVPVIFFGFGIFAALMMESSDSFMSVSTSINPGPEGEITGMQALGMMMGLMLTLFIMMYGSQIFNKVKTEKCNRIVEILATCVPGRTMMLAKIISVGLVGLTQLLLWGILLAALIVGGCMITGTGAEFLSLLNADVLTGLLWSVAFFIGGYIFYGSLFAAVGAMTDKNNENQEYVAVLTFILLASFYIGEYAVDNGNTPFSIACFYIPFTSSTVGAVNACTEAVPMWMTALSLVVLYAFALGALALAGKIYTSSLLLKGKRFTPRDIITFLKMK